MRLLAGNSSPDRSAALRLVREQLQALDDRGRGGHVGVFATGWELLDGSLPRGGLRFGAIHEWTGLYPPDSTAAPGPWSPPISLLLHLARRARAAADENASPRRVVWIGRSIWPSCHALAAADGAAELLRHSLLIDPPDKASRWWAIDAALRSPGMVVIADGSRLDLAASRRLQLAAEAGGSAGLLARPPADAGVLSAAWSRWVVHRAAGGSSSPRWCVRLASCKGAASLTDRKCVLELNDGRVVDIPPDVRRGHDAAAATA